MKNIKMSITLKSSPEGWRTEVIEGKTDTILFSCQDESQKNVLEEAVDYLNQFLVNNFDAKYENAVKVVEINKEDQ